MAKASKIMKKNIRQGLDVLLKYLKASSLTWKISGYGVVTTYYFWEVVSKVWVLVAWPIYAGVAQVVEDTGMQILKE